ncbi:MAG: hypothetical protein ACRDYC_14225, partial [Acidimicrobiales bacterium]
MLSLADSPLSDPKGAARTPRRRPHWWGEILAVAAFYAAYSAVRDLGGRIPVSARLAYQHALDVLSIERHLGIAREASLQRLVLHSPLVVSWLDVWYGATPFVV